MVDNILGVEIVQQLLELIHVLQVGRVELHLLFVYEIASTHLKNARTITQLRLLLAQIENLRIRFTALV